MSQQATKQSQKIAIIAAEIGWGSGFESAERGSELLLQAGLGERLQAKVARIKSEPSMANGPLDGEELEMAIMNHASRVSDAVLDAVQKGMFPVVIGGDHTSALGFHTGLARAFGETGIVWVDTHPDLNTPETSPSGNIHGMPLAHILGYGDSELSGIGGFQGKVDPSHVALVGVRDIDPQERGLMKESGIHVFTMRDIDERGMAEVGQEVLSVIDAGTDGFHVSFDVDGLDPEVAPGSGTLVPGGVSFREAHLLLELCADTSNMVSMEVVELNPILDIRNETAERVKQLIQSAFGLSIL